MSVRDQRANHGRGLCNGSPSRVTRAAATVMKWRRGSGQSWRLAHRPARCRSRYLPLADCVILLGLRTSDIGFVLVIRHRHRNRNRTRTRDRHRGSML